MKFIIERFHELLFFILIAASVNVALSGAGLYMVLVGYAKPGEPIYLDELAPTTSESTLTIVISLLVIAGVMIVRWYLRKVLGNMPKL